MFRLARTGGEVVEAGSYWNFTTGDRVEVRDSAALPGDAEATYFRLPPLAMLLVAPALGLLYALFLPFIGIAMLLTLVGRKLFGGFRDWFWKMAAFGWRPSEAYLVGRKKDRRAKNEDTSEHEPDA